MNFELKKAEDLSASLILNIETTDYQSKVEKAIKGYARKANIPGFRPGKVPADLVKRMYGESVLSEEILRIASDAVYNYIDENKIDVILNPILDDEAIKNIVWKDNASYNMKFDMIVAPEIDVVVDESIKLTKYEIMLEDSEVENQINDLRERMGKFDPIEKIDEKSFFSINISERENTEDKEKHFEKLSHLRTNTLPENIKKIFLEKANGDSFDINIAKDIPNTDDLTLVFNITSEEAKNISGDFEIKIMSVLGITPAEIDEKFLSQIMPDRVFKDKEELFSFIKKDLAATYDRESDRMLYINLRKILMEKHKINFPEELLKKIFKSNNDQKFSEEEINTGLPSLTSELNWQIIEKNIAEKYNISTTKDAILEYIKDLLTHSSNGESEDEISKKVQQTYDIIIKDKKRAENLIGNLFDKKVISLFKDNCNLSSEQTTWKKFVEITKDLN